MVRPPQPSAPPEFPCAARQLVLPDAQGIPSPGRDRRRHAPTRLGQRGHSADELRFRISTSSKGRARAPIISRTRLSFVRCARQNDARGRSEHAAVQCRTRLELLNCFHDRLLNRKDALRIDKRFRRIVEVDVFNIEIRDQCVVIPERTANFKTTG